MSLTAHLDAASVTAAPGEETRLPLQVRNSGSTVEEYRFEVVGACATWTTVEPATLSLYPGSSETATVIFQPPRDPSVPAGETPFGIRVVPTSDHAEPVVPEGRVTVSPFMEVTAELVPRGSQGARAGRHKAAVDNRGNAPLTATLSAVAATEQTQVSFTRKELRIEPGRAAFTELRVRSTKRLWRGTPLTHTFQVLVTQAVPEGEEPPAPVVLDGTYQQQPLLPRWLPRALVLACVLALALVGAWYGLLRPAVKSAAREAITPEVIASATASASPGKGGGGGASGGGSGGKDGAPTTAPPTSAAPSPSATGSAKPKPAAKPPAPPAPTSAQVLVRDAVGGGAESGTALTVADGKTFRLTDIVVQNPQGDAGTVVVRAGGRRILTLALENFRDSDYHFVTPVLVSAGDAVTLTVDCRKVGRPVGAPQPDRCSTSLFLGGTLQSNKSS